jgi:hypothetical protein
MSGFCFYLLLAAIIYANNWQMNIMVIVDICSADKYQK